MGKLALVLIVLTSVGGPAMAQAPGQLLQGLLSGNQGQDQAVRDAFERGYRRGREDQQRADRSAPPGRGYSDEGGNQPRGYQQPNGPAPYGR